MPQGCLKHKKSPQDRLKRQSTHAYCGEYEREHSNDYDNNDDEQLDEVEPEPTKPVNELTTEEKVIGTYEAKEGADTERIVLLENGVAENYYNVFQIDSGAKWEISKEGEIHIQHDSENTFAYEINADGSITEIAFIYRGDRSEEPSITFKKTK